MVSGLFVSLFIDRFTAILISTKKKRLVVHFPARCLPGKEEQPFMVSCSGGADSDFITD